MENNILLQVGVKILLKNKDGKYLLIHRSAEKYPEVKDAWDIVGGRINLGTSLMENLSREVFEETKLKIVGEPKLIAAQDILKTQRHIVRLTYVGEAEGKIVLDKTENDDYKWLSKEELLALKGLDVYFAKILNRI